MGESKDLMTINAEAWNEGQRVGSFALILIIQSIVGTVGTREKSQRQCD